MMKAPEERLRRTVDAHTEAVRGVRALDTDYREDEDEATFDAKLALNALDTGLVAPRFWGLAILTYTPDAAGSAGLAGMLDALEPLDATARAGRIVAVAREEGPPAAQEAARALAAELRAWAEAALGIPEVQAALAAYRAEPYALNLVGKTTEAI